MCHHTDRRRAAVRLLLIAALAVLQSAARVSAAEADTTSSAAPAISTPVESKSDPVANSVVKIFSTMRYPDPYKPWTKQAPTEVTGSGVVIEGKRILTCAHVVTYASQVQVQANQSGDRSPATVEAVSTSMDLAVLKLEDASFFDSHRALPRASNLPEIRDTVMAYGYPRGGSGLSITKGIVSRIEFTGYNYPASGLRIQIDAAINPGNSGGPAVAGDRMIGLAFGLLNNSQNIGYIIPCEEIDLFLRDIADGHYDGKPALFDQFQQIGNPALRTYLKLDKSAEGCIVRKVDSTDPSYPLHPWDVVTRISDIPLDDQGYVKIGDNLRVLFTYEVQRTATNGTVRLTILRAGKEMKLDVPVRTHRELLIPGLEGGYPSYFVYGPLVFSTATSELVGGAARGVLGGTAMTLLGVSGSPLMKRMSEQPAFEGERLVVVSSPFFPHRLSRGYGNPAMEVVKTINGVTIRNLAHLVEVLRDSKDEFIVIDFENRGGETLVFRRADMNAATEEILTDNDLRSRGSPDTLAVWNTK
jgi:S1-C subfamily serine protease